MVIFEIVTVSIGISDFNSIEIEKSFKVLQNWKRQMVRFVMKIVNKVTNDGL